MKIAISCKSILLEKTLRIFLNSYIVAFDECSFLISDVKFKSKKPIFLIKKGSGHLNFPFTKKSLITALEEFSATVPNNEGLTKINIEKKEKNINFEKKLDILMEEFKHDLIKLIKKHNEK